MKQADCSKDMASPSWQSGLYQINHRPRVYELSYGRHGKLSCTRRRVDMWLDGLPEPTQRPQSLFAPPLSTNAQETKAQSDLGGEPDLEDLRVVTPRQHHHHENPLRQHPIRHIQLPIRLRVPQRQSSLSFKHRSSRNSLQTSVPASPQLASPEVDISNLQLGLPKRTITTGFHLNYSLTRASRQQFDLPKQTATTGLHFNSPQNAITRPQPAFLAPRHSPGIQIEPRRSQSAQGLQVDLQALNDQILAHFDPPLQKPVSHSEHNMEYQDSRDQSQETVVAGSPAAIPSIEAAQTAIMLQRQASQMSQVRQLFGRDTPMEVDSRKRSRSDTPASMASLPPTKRIRGAVSNARNRLSRVMTPADDVMPEGRQSRIDRLTQAAKRLSLAAPPQMIRVSDFGPGVAKETVKIAILGNSGVGKTKLVQAFRTGSYEEVEVAPILHQVADGYVINGTNLVLDGVPVVLETWDVSSQCNESEAYGNSIRPLMATFYDVVILCYDVSDETTLKAVENKWAHDAERFCAGAPTILLGLKTDLRRNFPSLRLTHLKEPAQASTGQGEAAGKKIVVQAFYEVSAKTGEGVADFFESVIRFALQRRSRRSRGPVACVKKVFKDLRKGIKRTMQ